ncbi:MAG TPA: hypothetical protein VEM40_05715 [Nitrospirota bacterium]|nr:hypothetical protein [Nitrospirota bacterium]
MLLKSENYSHAGQKQGVPRIKMHDHLKYLATQGTASMIKAARVASQNLFLYRLPSAVKYLGEKMDKP